MGYRPNQPRPSAPTPAGGPRDRVREGVYVLVGLLMAVLVVGIAVGWLDQNSAPMITTVVGGLIGWVAWRGSAPALPDPRETARALTRAQLRAELDVDRRRAAWLSKTIALEMENGITVDPDYAREVDELTARMVVRQAQIDALAEQEREEQAEATRRAVPRPAPHPPRPPQVRGSGSPVGGDGFIAPYARDWSLRHADPELLSGRERTELEQEIVRRMTTAEPVRIITSPGPTIRRRHACSTVDCNGYDSPHCRMSQPCTCMLPGRGWRECPQHPELGPL